jgi:hypothetical protein
MMFVGREAELNYLNQYYAGADSRILVVYGQKGVGKTALLKHFGTDKSYVYYLARSCSDREQRFQWARELEESGGVLGEFPEYEDIFARVAQVPGGQKLVFVLDEFHHMVKGDPGFFSKLSHFVKNHSAPVLVILCSSAAGWVENSMVGKIGSEAASISGFLKLRELSIQKMKELYPDYGEDDSIQLYAVLGGVPGLWNRTDSRLPFEENLVWNILNKYSSLYGEMAGCLAEELRETAVYNTILATMASGSNKLNDIYQHTGFSRAKISVYLKNLMEIDLVEKVGAGIYRITRSYVRFYFCFIYPHQSLFEELTPERFYKEIVEDAFPGFVRETYRKS